MSHNPNTVKSFDELNEGGRKSDVVLSAVEKCERLQKQLDIAVKALKQYTEAKDMYLKAQDGTEIRLVNTKFYVIEKALKEIEELNK